MPQSRSLRRRYTEPAGRQFGAPVGLCKSKVWCSNLYDLYRHRRDDRATIRACAWHEVDPACGMPAFAPLSLAALAPQRRHVTRAAALSSRAAPLPCCAVRSRRVRVARRGGLLRAAADPPPPSEGTRARVVACTRVSWLVCAAGLTRARRLRGSQTRRKTTARRLPSRRSCNGAASTAAPLRRTSLRAPAASPTPRRAGRRTRGLRPIS